MQSTNAKAKTSTLWKKGPILGEKSQADYRVELIMLKRSFSWNGFKLLWFLALFYKNSHI